MSDPKYVNIGSPEVRVIEECGEVISECGKFIKGICKAQRFGWSNHHPDTPERTNVDDVKAEMADCVEAFEKLEIMLRQLTHNPYSTTLTGCKDLRSPLAKARDDFMSSAEGMKCLDPGILIFPHSSQYLRNRIEIAFLAGAKAQI